MMTTASIATPSSGTSIAAIALPAAATPALPQLCIPRPPSSAATSVSAVRWYAGRNCIIEKIR